MAKTKIGKDIVKAVESMEAVLLASQKAKDALEKLKEVLDKMAKGEKGED